MKKLYRVITECREDVYRLYVPAENEKAAAEWANGNGDIIDVKDVTEDHALDVDKIMRILSNAGIKGVEYDLIMRLLHDYKNAI